jgi:hypothetical protein
MKEFRDLAAFSEHILKTALAEEIAIRSTLGKCAKAVEVEAKSEIGHYQDEAGPFAAWADLADSTKEDRVRKGYTEDDPGLRSGEMRDSIGTALSVTGLEAQIGSDDDHLAFFELGTSKQPPRSVLGTALVRKMPEIQEALGLTVFAALLGKGVVGGGAIIAENELLEI